MKYQIDGILADSHPTYIKRAADNELIRYLQNGKFCYVFSSPQMGKSSLRMRTANNLPSDSFVCAHIDRSNIISPSVNEKDWYGGFLQELDTQFNLGMDRGWFSQKKWNEQGSEVLDEFINEILLEKVKINIVVFIDDLENILKSGFSLDSLWNTINRCYENRNQDPRYERLNFVPIGVATISDLKIDNNANPLFKNGLAIELTAFTEAQVAHLMPGLPNIPKDKDKASEFIKQLLQWSGGQPVLTQKIFDLIQKSNLDNFDESLVKGLDIDSLLDRIRRRLTETNSSLELLLESLIKYLKIHDNQNGINNTKNPTHEELQISGVVIKVGTALRIFNPIYKDKFNREWVQKELRDKKVVGNRYLKKEELGSGGFGSAFLVKDLDLKGHPFLTIKQLTASTENQSDLQKKQDEFEKEAEILRGMKHERIPRMYHSFEEDRQLFIVQEYIQGQTLLEKFNELKKTKVYKTEHEVIQVLINILEIVYFVHKEGVIHRDIKPSNLIERGDDCQLVLIDFGAGKFLPKILSTQNINTTPPFSYGYAAPEQLGYKPVTGTFSDIYSIGIIAIEAITHINPWEVLREKEAIKNFPWREQNKIAVSKELGGIIDKMTCYEAKHRYQSAQEVLNDLKKIKIASKVTTSPSGVTTGGGGSTINLSHILLIAIVASPITLLFAVIFGILINNTVPNCFVKNGLICWNNPQKSDGNPVQQPIHPDSQNPNISSGDKDVQVYQGDPKTMNKKEIEFLRSVKKERGEGIAYFKGEKYFLAYKKFYTLIKKYKQKNISLDPSLLIYLNNSKVRYLHSLRKNSNKIYKIAVMAPTNTETGKSIISGVALKQNIIVNGINKEYTNLSKYDNPDLDLKKAPNFYLEVIIADDQNIPANAKTISEELSTDSDVISVVGSYTSEVTCEAVRVLSKKNVHIISPNSELMNLRKNCGDDNNVFIRTILSTHFEATSLINKLRNVQNDFKDIDIIIFYKKEKSYKKENKEEKPPTEFSQDLFDQFTLELSPDERKKVQEFDLENTENELNKKIEEIKKTNRPTVIVLFPDGGVISPTALNNAKKIAIELNKNKNDNIKLILGSNPLWSQDIAELKDLHGILLLAVDWATGKSCDSKKNQFVEMANTLMNGTINRTVASSYEATQISIEVILTNSKEKSPKKLNAIEIKSEVYKNRNISVQVDGDRNGDGKILVTPSSSSSVKEFKILDPDQCP
jgi:serine/threonine protein kinase/ABC-type branched-subunit amino acid transport system substrate-binding protein